MEWILNLLGAPSAQQGQPWHFIFERPAPTWLWLVGLIVIFSMPIISYANIRGERGFRIILASLRTIVLLFIAAMVQSWRRVRRRKNV